MSNYNFFCPTRVLFGQGSLNEFHKQPMPGKKALLVISNGQSTIKNGSLERVKKELAAANCEYVLFNEVAANPLKSIVEKGAQVARQENCDFVVALGGGSVMDAAKVMAMFIPQPSDDLWDYADGKTGKLKPLDKEPLPWIAITTSAGTGSEVDTAGVITNPDTNEKIGVGGPDSLFAKFAIVDPELMKTVPPKFTAYQGFDALFHSLEGYISCVHNPMSDLVQRTAIENIGKYLPRAVKDGNDMARFLGKQEANDPMDFIDALVKLEEDCGVSELKMSDYGIKEDECMTMAVNARETMGGLFMADPAKTTHEEIAEIYRRTYK